MRWIWLIIATLCLTTAQGSENPLDQAGRTFSRFIYSANDTDDTLSILAIERARLRSLGYVYLGRGAGARSLVVAPSQKFLFLAGSTPNIRGYSIDLVSGTLTPVPHSPFATTAVSKLAIDPFGRFLIAANSKGLFVYAIAENTGSLRLMNSIATEGISDVVVGRASIVYAVHSTQNLIDAYAVDPETDRLAELSGSPYETGLNPSRPTLDPFDRFLFVPNHDGNSVSAYTIDSKNGGLKEIPGSPFRAGHGPTTATTSRTGNFLYVSNVQDRTISQYSVNQTTGTLTSLTDSFSTGSSGAFDLVISPDNPLLFAADHDSNEVRALGIHTSGTLFNESLIRVRGSTISLAIASGTNPVTYAPEFVYECNVGSNDVWAYRVSSSTGALNPVVASPFKSGAGPTTMAAPLHSRFLFAANAQETSISAFVVSQNGALSAAPGSPFHVGRHLGALATDADAHFLYSTNPTSNTISAYRVSPSGGLVELSGSPFRSHGEKPQGAVVDPRGLVLYVANSGANSVSAYAITAATGTLTFIGAQPAGNEPTSLAVDRSGQFLYALNAAGGDVSPYRISGATGALSPPVSAPSGGAAAASAIESIPFGNRVYLTQPTQDTIAGYTIFGNTGTLKLLRNSPFAASGAPNAIDFDLSSHFAYTANSSDDSISVFLVSQKTGNLVPARIGPFQAGSHPMAVIVANQMK